jgi:hypothetical protein
LRGTVTILLLAASWLGCQCSTRVDEERFACTQDSDCVPGFVCLMAECVRESTGQGGGGDAGASGADAAVADAGETDAGCEGADCPCEVGRHRACYPYGAGLVDPTLDLGVCHAGTQLCGTDGGDSGWGPCSGAIVPSAERCDGKDDNCDGQIDEHCPSGISAAPGQSSRPFGGSDGGTAYEGACASGQVALGMSIVFHTGYALYAVSLFCGALDLKANTAVDPATYTVDIVPGSSAGPFGNPTYPGTGTDTYQCPTGSMLWSIDGKEFSGGLTYLVLHCASLSVQDQGGFKVVRGPTTTSPLIGTPMSSLGSLFSFDCPTGQVMTGIYGRAQAWVDTMGVRCGLPTLQLNP